MTLIAIYGPPGTGKTEYALKVLAEASEEGRSFIYETYRRWMMLDARARFIDFFDEPSEGIRYARKFIVTTHALCKRLLGTTILSGKKLVSEIKKVMRDCNIFMDANAIKELLSVVSSDVVPDISELKTLPAKIYTAYSYYVDMFFDRKLFEMRLPLIEVKPTKVYDFTERWIEHLDSIGMADFPYLLVRGLDVEPPEVDIYIADEFHDKTKLKFELFKRHSSKAKKRYILFDPQQSIYGYAGADPKYSLKLWEEASKRMMLSPSLRVSEEQRDFAAKKLGKPLDFECAGSTKIREVSRFLKLENLLTDDTLVLARTRGLLADFIENTLLGKPIVWDGFRGWASRRDFVDALLRCRISQKLSYDEFQLLFKYLKASAFNGKKAQLKRRMDEARKMGRLSFNVESFLSREFLRALREGDIDSFLDQRLMEGYTKNLHSILQNNGYRYIHLRTIHGAKGATFANVIVLRGITAKIARAIQYDNFQREEERRVWYVAVTRASQNLYYCDYPFTIHTFPEP